MFHQEPKLVEVVKELAMVVVVGDAGADKEAMETEKTLSDNVMWQRNMITVQIAQLDD